MEKKAKSFLLHELSRVMHYRG